VRLRAPRGAAVSAVARAWVHHVTDLHRAVEMRTVAGSSRPCPSLVTVTRAVDDDANYQSFAQHLEAFQPEEAAAPTRFNAQSVVERRAHADKGPSGRAPPSARDTRARSVSQDSGASVGSRYLCRRD